MPQRIPYAKGPAAPSAPPPRDLGKVERDKFYSSAAWRRLRSAFLAANPLCEACQRNGQVVAATLVHHRVERLAAPLLALDWLNLESSCDSCHSTEHARRRRLDSRPGGGI